MLTFEQLNSRKEFKLLQPCGYATSKMVADYLGIEDMVKFNARIFKLKNKLAERGSITIRKEDAGAYGLTLCLKTRGCVYYEDEAGNKVGFSNSKGATLHSKESIALIADKVKFYADMVEKDKPVVIEESSPKEEVIGPDAKIMSFSSDLGEIRVVVENNKEWLVANDVATVLGYTNPSKAIIDHVDAEDKVKITGVFDVLTTESKLNNEMLSSFIKGSQNNGSLNTETQQSCGFGQRGNWLINESGLYSLVLSSKLPTAKKFKRWVTNDVLPSIRKRGVYMTDEAIEKSLSDPDFIIKIATELKEARQRNQGLTKVNRILEKKERTWDDRKVLVALMRAYAGKMGDYANKDIYREVLYKYSINLEIRRSLNGKKGRLIDYIRKDEFPKFISVAIAMCDSVGLDSEKYINEVNFSSCNCS